VTPDPTKIIDGQNSVDLCTFLASRPTSPSIDKYVQTAKLQIRPTDVAACNIPSGNGICFSVYIFTALGAPYPPPPRLNPTVYTAIYRERKHLHSENAAVAAMWDG
jgi:hypothetical protein